MELTTQQLQFIDKYLKESGVQYNDIRYEMTDHVASAIEGMEGDFYESFKQYMLVHKKELLDTNRAFNKASFYRALRVLQNIFSKPLFGAIAVFLIALFWVVKNITAQDITTGLSVSLITISTITYGYFLYQKFISNYNNSVIDKLISIVYCAIVVFRADRVLFVKNNLGAVCFYSFSIAFFIVLLQSLYKINRQYKLRYEL
jgi:hypothetical protein